MTNDNNQYFEALKLMSGGVTHVHRFKTSTLTGVEVYMADKLVLRRAILYGEGEIDGKMFSTHESVAFFSACVDAFSKATKMGLHEMYKMVEAGEILLELICDVNDEDRIETVMA